MQLEKMVADQQEAEAKQRQGSQLSEELAARVVISLKEKRVRRPN